MFTTTLYPYQDGDLERFLRRGNLLLAYDMGLGKTVVSIAAAEELIGRGEAGGDAGPVLIICPSGLRLQWASEIALHTDVATREITHKGMTFLVPEERYAVVIDGGPQRRKQLYQQIAETHPDYVIAGYQIVTAELRWFRRMWPTFIVLDEGTAIKNPAADVTKAIRRLTAKWRLMLTGTPVERKLEELFHLLGWVDPAVLGDPSDRKAAIKFDRSFLVRNYWGRVVGYKNTDVLHRKVSGVLIRRRVTDPEVAPYMPKLKRRRLNVTMDAATAMAYRKVVADLAAELASLPARAQIDIGDYYQGIDENTPAGRVMAVYTAAQQLIDDPGLLAESPSAYAQHLAASGVLDGLPESPKIRALARLVADLLKDPEAKVIIVSRFRRLVERLAQRWPSISVIYHGQMSVVEKQAAVHKFRTDPDARLFIMSHAGAYGVNLPVATHLINVDPARSAGQRAQIDHRHVRASSTHGEVEVIDMVTVGTIEERAYDRLDLQGRVSRAVIDGVGADEHGRIDDDVITLTAHCEAVLSAA